MKDQLKTRRLIKEAIALCEQAEALLLKARAAHEAATRSEMKRAA